MGNEGCDFLAFFRRDVDRLRQSQLFGDGKCDARVEPNVGEIHVLFQGEQLDDKFRVLSGHGQAAGITETGQLIETQRGIESITGEFQPFIGDLAGEWFCEVGQFFPVAKKIGRGPE